MPKPDNLKAGAIEDNHDDELEDDIVDPADKLGKETGDKVEKGSDPAHKDGESDDPILEGKHIPEKFRGKRMSEVLESYSKAEIQKTLREEEASLLRKENEEWKRINDEKRNKPAASPEDEEAAIATWNERFSNDPTRTMIALMQSFFQQASKPVASKLTELETSENTRKEIANLSKDKKYGPAFVKLQDQVLERAQAGNIPLKYALLELIAEGAQETVNEALDKGRSEGARDLLRNMDGGGGKGREKANDDMPALNDAQKRVAMKMGIPFNVYQKRLAEQGRG